MQELQGVEWDTIPVLWKNGPAGFQNATVVNHKTPSTPWKPWLIVAESALLNSMGFKGQGLYAAKAFSKDSVMGRYEGKVVGVFKSRAEALESDVTKRLVWMQQDKLITRQRKSGGVELVDGETQGPPFLAKVNDPRGTKLQPNVFISPFGYMKVSQTRVPAFDFGKDLIGNKQAELRYSYGSQYWRMMSGARASTSSNTNAT